MAELLSIIGSFVTEGEKRAAEVLKQLPDSWLVICNKTLPTRNGRSHEMDFVVVGKRWVFLLDEKSWIGKIRGNDELWIRADDSSERSPLAKVDYVAKVLAGHLSWRVPALKGGGHFVRSGVLLSAADNLPQIFDPRAADGIFLLTDVCQHLQALDSYEGNPYVGQVHNLVKNALVNLSDRPAFPKRIDLYTIDDVILIRPGVRLFHATMDGGEPRLLMVYDLGKDPLAARENYEFYLREFKVLQELRTTGLVAEVRDPSKWSDDFLIIPIVPLKGKPLSVYPHPETREELGQELLLAAASFKGLDVIHSKGILHRAIGPDIVYVLQGGQTPKIAFTNFFAARVGTTSIAAPLDKLDLAAEDPYASMDLAIGYEYATFATDVFSLALVFLERIAGVPIATIRASIESDIAFPDLQKRWSILPTDFTAELSDLFQQIVMPDHLSPLPSGKEIVARLGELARRLQAGVTQDEEKYLLEGRFKVHRVLGQGSMAKTYLASYADYADAGLGLFVLKQFLRPSEVYEQAVAEYRALMSIKSKYLPSILEIYRQQDDAHIKMEYIPGPTMKELEATLPWPIDRWWSFAQDLMNAIEELEKRHLLHRDIKSENIILYEGEQHPVLIDLGFAIQQGTVPHVRAAGTPLYMPPEASLSPVPPSSCDRYAAGIVLFRMLTGFLPFELTGTQQHILRIPEHITDEKVRRVASVLLGVVSNDPTERPASIDQMRQELQAAVLAVEESPQTHEAAELVNPWVDDIRSLYRNSESGNANNRGLDSPFVRETYVATALDLRLLPAIFEYRPKAIFLSGNPGDGKTAFLEQLKKELESKQAIFHKRDDSGWECVYDGHIFRSCYDASEANQGLSADEQLAQKLLGLEGISRPEVALTVLIAINDGRLMDYFERHKEQFHWLAKQIEHTGDESELRYLAVWLIDLKRRAFVNVPDVDEPSIFTRVLQSLVAQEHWQVCEDCAAADICPIRYNAGALRRRNISKWLEYLLLLTHLRLQRHMTIRDLRSALAYLITGNSSCRQVHEARKGEEAGASLINLTYWRSAFAPLELNDELLRDMANLDPARFVHPQLDRFLHFHHAPEAAEERRYLFADQVDLPSQRFRDEREWMAAIKRRLYFEISREVSKGAKTQNSVSQIVPRIRRLPLLPYRYAKDFVALLDGRFDDEDLRWIRERLALGILRSDGIIEDMLPGKLSVKVNASEEQQLIVLKQINLEDFEIYQESFDDMQVLERIPEFVIFEHSSGTPRLEITLDLFELLMRMADGLLPDAQEYQPLLEDLKRFKDVLLLQETHDLVLIENQYRIHQIAQLDGKITRIAL